MPNTPGVPDHADPADNRPEPVRYAAQIGGLLSAVLVAVGGVIALVAGGLTIDELGPLGIAIGGVIVAVVALGVYLLPVWQAITARAKVTPLASPRNDAGIPLIEAPGFRTGPAA
jgi:hypothetical protein